MVCTPSASQLAGLTEIPAIVRKWTMIPPVDRSGGTFHPRKAFDKMKLTR